jgi:pantoate kinase
MTLPLKKPYKIRVEHDAQIPIGSGFGASGGGALSLALALNEALDLGLSRVESARIAHVAEIECRTGLGTVLAELSGGFGIIAKPGGPGVGETMRFIHADDLSAVCLHFGPISTKEALSDPRLRNRINELGGRFVDELRGDQSVSLFMELSRRFAEHVGLITPRIRAVLGKADNEGIPCTMAMFGETVFSLVEGGMTEKVAKTFSDAAPGKEVLIAGIDDRGARIL